MCFAVNNLGFHMAYSRLSVISTYLPDTLYAFSNCLPAIFKCVLAEIRCFSHVLHILFTCFLTIAMSILVNSMFSCNL